MLYQEFGDFIVVWISITDYMMLVPCCYAQWELERRYPEV